MAETHSNKAMSFAIVGKGDTLLEELVLHQGSSSICELQNLPAPSKCCMLSGILAIIQPEALRQPVMVCSSAQPNMQVMRSSQKAAEGVEGGRLISRDPVASSEGVDSYRRGDLLVDGAIPFACSMVESSTDDECKQHALAALTAALQQASNRIQVCLILFSVDQVRHESLWLSIFTSVAVSSAKQEATRSTHWSSSKRLC